MSKWVQTFHDQWEADEGELVVGLISGKYFWSFTIFHYRGREFGWDEIEISQGECDSFEEAKWKAIRAKERFMLKQEVWAEHMEAQITEALENS